MYVVSTAVDFRSNTVLVYTFCMQYAETFENLLLHLY
jgi:hypothetical protein